MSDSKHNPRLTGTQLVFVLVSVLFLSSCFAAIKPIYNSQEQAKAEKAVVQLHRLRNEGRLAELYALLDDSIRAEVNSDQFALLEKQALDKWGKVVSAKLSEAKVMPSSPIQVRMIYNVQFEKGEAQEWIIWNIYGEEARLFVYELKPGFDKPDSKQ
ncbi:MAG TPA: hypothetical protein VLA93_09925 [Pyrinomonadaceae bacterium]|nr:hypothetical protein [Pyrinomonadaceae bacterium]